MKAFRIIFSMLIISMMTAIFAPSLKAQSSNKSAVVTEYNGKKYYIHTVQKKQTLQEIADIYDVTIYEILSENKDIKKNPKAGNIIRIPYKEIIIEELPSESEEVMIHDTISYQPEFIPTDYDSERLYKVALMMPLYLEHVDKKFQTNSFLPSHFHIFIFTKAL